ncbi:MAG TPA: LuxR C-terminal-related transcriptional regulator [Ktedonobacterales bacterium]|nr:LuxR C-terminal-related transcriptional regulator [Ktedonobacterales bacterium]
MLAHAHARAQAGGWLIFTCAGVQSEARLPFAGLHQLLRPVLNDVTNLPDPQRDALYAAFGMASSLPAPERFLIALAALNLLTGVAVDAPLLILVEDAQWLDRPTCDVLAFVARRLESDSVLLLFALRDGFSSVLLEAGLPQLYVEGVDATAAAALLDAQDISVDAAVRRRILENAAGNPLALIELPVALQAEKHGGSALLPPWMPLTTRLERAFSARASELPMITRTLLLVLVANDSESLSEALDAARSLSNGAAVSEEALEPAVEAGLVVPVDVIARFRHPLIRSALYQAAGGAQRRAAHAALAAVLADQPDRAIWHRAAALVGRDEQVATDLEAAARRALLRGANASAVTALERASQLTNNPTQQGKWLIEAAWLAIDYDNDLGRQLVQAAEPLELGPHERTEVLWFLEAHGEDGKWSGAARIRPFVEMADQARLNGEVDRALELLWRIALRCFWSNPDRETRALVAEAADRLPVPESHPLLNCILACSAPIEYGGVVIERLSGLDSAETDPVSAWLLGTAATAVGAFDRAVEYLSAAIASLRTLGRLGSMAQALVSQALATRYTGNWSIAAPAAEEASQLTRETKALRWMAAAQAIGAAVDGLRGETIAAQTSATEAEQVIRAESAHPMLALVQLARGATSLSAGHYAEAFEYLWRVFDPADIAYHPVVRCWAVGDLVDAAMRSNHHEQARAVVEEMETLASRSPFPALLAGLSYARPLLAEDDDAEALFLAGLDADQRNLALTRERLQLGYGSWLRRHQRRKEARAPLRAARDGFDALGAAPWAERARQELRATGESSHRREPGALDLLTPQEIQIAQLAAEGLSNREIGERLYLSHRTVGFHLYRIFPKLGVTSRAGLNASLGVGQGNK